MFHVVSEETYEDGQIIFKEGSSGDWVYAILSGSVEISRTVAGKTFVMSLLQPDEVFGELGFFGRIKRTATARAVGKTTVGVLDRTSLDVEFNGLSADFRAILVALVRRFENSISRTKEYTVRNEVRAVKSLSLTFRDHQSFIAAYTTNISPGGLFIKTETPLPKGEQFQLKLQFPGLSVPLKINCEVAWSRTKENDEKKAPGMGVKFCEMSKNDNLILQKYLKEVIPS